MVRFWGYIMWDELSINGKTVTIGNRHYKLFSRVADASSFLKLSLLLKRKNAYVLPIMVQYKFSLFDRSRKYRVESASRKCRVQL